MMKKIVILSFIVFVFYFTVNSQNNYNHDKYSYYNLKDTINKNRILTVPVFNLVDTQLKDSVTSYLNEIKKNEYYKIEENGIYIRIGLVYGLEDSTSIYVGIRSLLNRYLNFNLSDDAYSWRNVFLPDGYKTYLYGCFVVDGFIVIIETRKYVKEQELLRFFRPTGKHVEIHLYDSPEINLINTIPHKYFPIHLVSKTNYVYPVPPKKN